MIGIDDIVVGTCGECGGPVCIHRIWMGVQRQTPTCRNCGATAIPSHGPRLPMRPAEPPRGLLDYMRDKEGRLCVSH